jgi:hypothetical protein
LRRGGFDVGWFALSLAPAAWLVAQGAGYPLVKWVCATGNSRILLVISVIALLMTVAGALLGSSSLVSLSGVATGDGDRKIDRRYFVAQLAIGFNVLIALAIAATSLAQSVLRPCE